MAKYHISPTTGRPNLCHATVRACPVGGENEHYGTKEEAQTAFEQSMSGQTLVAVSKKAPAGNVVSLGDHKAKKLADHDSFLATARATSKFDESLASFPKYKLTKADEKMLADVAAGKKVSAQKLDEFMEDKESMAKLDAFNDEREVQAARGVLGYLKAVRSTDPTPSTLATIDNFDPSTQTVFSNPNARKSAVVMGKAIRREFAHSEWMHELAGEHRQSATWADQDGSEPNSAQYLQSAKNCEESATKSEARVQAQLRELQYLFDTDESFAKTANPEVRRMLTQGSFRGKASSYDGIAIGTVKAVK